MYIFIHTHTHTHTHVWIYLHAYIYMYVYIYIYTHNRCKIHRKSDATKATFPEICEARFGTFMLAYWSRENLRNNMGRHIKIIHRNSCWATDILRIKNGKHTMKHCLPFVMFAWSACHMFGMLFIL